MGIEGRTLLLIGDEEELRLGLRSHCRGWDVRLEEARTGTEGLTKAQLVTPETAVVDLVLPDMDGRDVLRQIQCWASPMPVIMLSILGDSRLVVEVMRLGAWDFLTKPVNWEQMQESVRGAMAGRLGDPSHRQKPYDPDGGGEAEGWREGLWIGEKMRRVSKLVDQLANTDATVLIRGETGVGKELVALALHRRSWRRGRPHAKVNCAALPGELVESELFGYERGAFTGAHQRKPGRFEQVDGGTIVLDEVGEMPLSTQGKLLQVLQHGEFTPLGGRGSLRVDVRVIACTNQDLERALEVGTFRKDLYYRLNVIKIWIPPLRERRDEIPVLAKYFFDKFTRRYHYPDAVGISLALMEHFLTYDWPGNVRELENVIKRIVVLGEEAGVLEDLARRPQPEIAGPSVDSRHSLVPLKELARQAAMQAERALIQGVLTEERWNRMKAARRLGISYKALLYKMRASGISPKP
ncbi:MAG: sigma-54-dependent Fis family transcriptional regulator [candidate division NC10 bacterium]|nr:sigma-54-dependent Fis family transcriptional regulator [candidate division NC10 bacterium]